jgi:NADP-reducing hydrogenase subunit HndC
MKKLTSLSELERTRKAILAEHKKKPVVVTVCSGTGCLTCGSSELFDALHKGIMKQGLYDRVDLRRTGCHGFCERGPVTVIHPKETCYLQMKPGDVPEFIEKTLIGDEIVERLTYEDPQTGKRIANLTDIPFYKYQKRILLENNAVVDPSDIRDYIAVGGYSALAKVLTKMKPEEVIEVIKEANLRGRGGGGFPAGVKWETTRQAPGEPKYVIVNGDEGDPGAYMDRSLLEGNPHGVLEGLIIGAYAIGAHEGFFYVRQEYPLALKNTQRALEQATQYGLLGEKILGTDFHFNAHIHRGAGAFVSGESSALMTAIEGHVGEPRPKYIHTSEKGLWDRPSCLNNVETWANVPFIINKGAAWFKKWAPRGAAAPRSFPWSGRSTTPDWWRCPWASPCATLSSRSGGESPRAGGSRRFRPEGPPEGCCLKACWTFPWISMSSPRQDP